MHLIAYSSISKKNYKLHLLKRHLISYHYFFSCLNQGLYLIYRNRHTFLMVAYAVKWPPVILQWFVRIICMKCSLGTTTFPVGKWIRAFSDSRYNKRWVHDLNFRNGLGRAVSSWFAKLASISSPLVGKYPWDKNLTTISYCFWLKQPPRPISSISNTRLTEICQFVLIRARDFQGGSTNRWGGRFDNS